ncbi:LysM peptidoglycan-binding domain-containing protein, partial [bacterium]|nr:LysM peptidoglycan-binding domain-containing protein [bacterium]
MKTKNIFRLAVVCTLSIFILACASPKEEVTEKPSDELSFSEFDESTTEDGVTIDEIAGDEVAMDDPDNVETDMSDLPGDEEIAEIEEIIDIEDAAGTEEMDETIVDIPAEPATYQKPVARKPYSRSKGYPDYPAAAASDGNYIVKKGDSLWAISRKYGIPVRSLAVANGMSINVPIKIGQKLIIPGVKNEVTPSVSSSATPSVDPSGKTYTVKSGDSYYKIGKAIGVNYLKLMKYNN